MNTTTDPKALADELERLQRQINTWAMAAMSAIENGQNSGHALAELSQAQNVFAGTATAGLCTILAALRGATKESYADNVAAALGEQP